MKFTPEQKAQVARYALELGNKRAIVRYSMHRPEGEYRQDVEEQRAHPGDLTRNVSNYRIVLPYCYCIAIIGIVALPCTLQLFCSVPDILVDVVASYAALNRKRCSQATSHSKTPLSVGSLHL